MMSLSQIRELSNQAARRAAREKRVPYVPFDAAEVQAWGTRNPDGTVVPAPIPNLGSYRPKGWKFVDEYFVDKSGFGSESEPAMTLRAFKAKLCSNIEAGHEYGYAIIEEGQFQMYVGVFEKRKKG